MYPQRFRATVMASPHPSGGKQTSTINKHESHVSEKDFSRANRMRAASFVSLALANEMAYSRIPQLAQLASKFESKSHSIRFRFPPRSIAAVHFRQKRISFIQCPAVKAGTSTASGDSASVHGLSMKSDRTILNTSAVSLPQLPCTPSMRTLPIRSPEKNSSTV